MALEGPDNDMGGLYTRQPLFGVEVGGYSSVG